MEVIMPPGAGAGKAVSGRCRRADDRRQPLDGVGPLTGVEVDWGADQPVDPDRGEALDPLAHLRLAADQRRRVDECFGNRLEGLVALAVEEQRLDPKRLRLEAEPAGEVDVEVRLPAAHPPEVEEQAGPDDVPCDLEVAVDRDLDRGADLEVGALPAALLEAGGEVLSPGFLECVGAEEDRDPAVADLGGHLDRLAADRADEHRDLVAERVEVELQRLALAGAALDRQLVVLAVM